MRSDFYQVVLIFLGVVVSALFGVFVYRELFPEYRIYQKDYIALEAFHSTYTGQPPAEFQLGVKQIVIPNAKGPETIDRCISCHVALQIPDFSPTKIAYDVNGHVMLDEKGWPLQIPNENYIWGKLGDSDLKRSEKVLQMHPLIGRETRPFEFHPLDDYGCVSCHGGNGRGLTTDKAHGPVFDGTYEEEFMGEKPQFLEKDPLNDPLFASVFNAKPGHELLFQTTPILVGSLMQAKCMQCHQSSASALSNTVSNVQVLAKRGSERAKAIDEGFVREKEALLSMMQLQSQIRKEGVEKTEEGLKSKSQDFTLPQAARKAYQSQLKFLQSGDEKLGRQIENSLGSPGLAEQLEQELQGAQNPMAVLDAFLNDNEGTGSLFVKRSTLNLEEVIRKHVNETEQSFANQKVISAMQSDVDYLTRGYQKGQELFISQACYACHRISGFSRGGVGPELTTEGDGYPWFIKESIVWPQADLKTSTMPNSHMDHEELEALMTYLLAQRSDSKVKSATEKKIAIQQWEQGKKLPWEKPITPVEMKDLSYAMTVFATEGCAACHRLKGFESNVGCKDKQWFAQLFPEEIKGSDIVKNLDNFSKEIDERIVDGVRKDSLLEAIEAKFPGTIESYYSNFKFAARAKNHEFTKKAESAKSPVEKAKALSELDAWKKRVRRVLLTYIQEYGLGRLVGPKPNWSGVYRSDEWLMEHFRNPSSLVARSIMPVFPFDDTKFYALTQMLDQLGRKNRGEVHEIWKMQGFDPQMAVKIFCSQCHGEFLEGHGPVADWIYPIPKNLRNAQFLRNLGKERVIQSIVHGVKGTPMPPWGEVATDKASSDGIPVITRDQAAQIVDWLFATLPGSRSEEEAPKWQYTPEKVLQELQEEGNGKNFHELFDVTAPPVPGDEKFGYYIKKEYYTPENLIQGQQFFELNCAVCHGKEGEGSGQRAQFLKEAKPRMLNNLNWLETRDDLRLLRSIKFGVPGTAMTPWGDLTSSLQRLQLVMFIRRLSEEPERRNKLFNALYHGFNRSELVIEEARASAYKLENIQDQIDKTRQELAAATPEKAGEIYTRELKLQQQLEKSRSVDQLLSDLKAEVRREREIYQGLGVALISKLSSDDDLLKLINLNDGRYTLKEGRLEIAPVKEEQAREISRAIIKGVDTTKSALANEKKLIAGRISSAVNELEISRITAEITAYEKLEQQITSGVEDALRSARKQTEIYQNYQKKKNEVQ